MPLLRSYWQRATSVLPSCVRHLSCLGPHLYSKRQLSKNNNFGTATRVEITRWLRNACRCIYFKQCHETLWSEKNIVCSRWRSLIFGWNSSFAPFTIQCPERYRCSLLRSFADRTNGTRLPCVHSLSNSVCQGPVCSSIVVFSMFSLARATWRGALAVSNMSHKNCDRIESSWDLWPMIWRIQKRRQRCRRRLLKSAPSQCEWVCAWACAFARLPLHLSPLLGGLKFRVSLHQLLGEQALVIVAQMMDPFLMWTPKFYCKKIVRLAFFRFVLVLWSGNACRRNT